MKNYSYFEISEEIEKDLLFYDGVCENNVKEKIDYMKVSYEEFIDSMGL